MTLAWCILADFGVLILYFKQCKWRNVMHGFTFLLAAGLTTFTVIVMLREFNPQPAHMDLRHRLHYCLGLGVLGWVGVQVLLGIIVFLMPWCEVQPMTLLRIRQTHRWSGYVLVVFAKLQVILGWWMYRSYRGVGLVIADLLIFVFGLICASNNESKPIPVEISPYNTNLGKSSLTDLILSNILDPYNSRRQRQLAPYIVFDDWVYLLEDGFHPGGQLLIDKVRYREVDRYLYGMYPIEDYRGSPQHTHSSNSINVLAKKIGRLPTNQVYVMRDCQPAVIGYCNRINERLAVFYLNAGAQYNEQFDLRHIGQYFRVTLQGYSKVRLYTAVCCLSQLNRKRVQEILARAGLPTVRDQFVDDPTLKSQHLVPLVIRCYPEKDGFTRRLY